MLCHLLTKLELTASASMAQRFTDDCVFQWVKYGQFLVKFRRLFLLKSVGFSHKLHLSVCNTRYCDKDLNLEMFASHKPFAGMSSVGQVCSVGHCIVPRGIVCLGRTRALHFERSTCTHRGT